MKKNTHITLILIIMLVFTGTAISQTIYVDNKLASDCKGNYSIAKRDNSGSDGDAYMTIQSAANAATAGTTVVIRGGVYREELKPGYSGTELKKITFKGYVGEVAEITGETLTPAIWIEKKEYIVLDGLKVQNVRRWFNALGCNYLVIKNCTFKNAKDSGGSSKTGLFFQSCNFCKIVDNVIDSTTQDNVGLIDSDHNLLEGNSITRGKHVLWTLKCSNYNVIRKNYFHNSLQKIGEIFDCDNVGYGEGEFPKITSLNDSKYNIVERNIFAYTPSPANASPYAGIQYAGQYGIIRNNVFYECEGPPVDLTYYSDEAKYNYGNRISHNVFFDNEFGGIGISGTENNFRDQKIKNNIFFKNKFIQRDFRWSWYNELNSKPVQIFTGRINEIEFENNDIFNSEVDELYVIAYGVRTSSSNPAPEPLSWWEKNHGNAFKNNLQTDPGFVNTEEKDFHLKANSLMIDAGAFLTKTTGSGNNSTTMEVDDAGWFTDGFGIIPGDTIQVEGQTNYAVIRSVQYLTKTLTLDRAFSWEPGQGVSLKYCGEKPDIGAYEFSSLSSGMGTINRKEGNIILYPNPTNGTIRIENDCNETVDKVLVYSNFGQLMWIDSGDEINLSGLSAGFYYVKITFKNGKETVRKVIKRI
jgi:hypothetical protein